MLKLQHLAVPLTLSLFSSIVPGNMFTQSSANKPNIVCTDQPFVNVSKLDARFPGGSSAAACKPNLLGIFIWFWVCFYLNANKVPQPDYSYTLNTLGETAL